jgi:hypothetical protein
VSVIFFADSLVYEDYHRYLQNFRWPLTQGESREDNLLYHCLWIGRLTAHHEFCLKSLLLTQSPPFEVWVWMPPGDLVSQRWFVDAFHRHENIKFLPYVPVREAEGTVYQPHPELLNGRWRSRSDGFRHLILKKYGGIYFDMDVLFLRDLRPLCSVDFFYQWSNRPWGNTALFHLSQGSVNADPLMVRSIRIGSANPSKLTKFSDIGEFVSNIHVFPSFVFDPVWIANDIGIPINNYCNRVDDFFTVNREVNLETFFSGSYAYHWHNRWDIPIRQSTIAGYLYAEVNRRLDDCLGPKSEGLQ